MSFDETNGTNQEKGGRLTTSSSTKSLKTAVGFRIGPNVRHLSSSAAKGPSSVMSYPPSSRRPSIVTINSGVTSLSSVTGKSVASMMTGKSVTTVGTTATIQSQMGLCSQFDDLVRMNNGVLEYSAMEEDFINVVVWAQAAKNQEEILKRTIRELESRIAEHVTERERLNVRLENVRFNLLKKNAEYEQVKKERDFLKKKLSATLSLLVSGPEKRISEKEALGLMDVNEHPNLCFAQQELIHLTDQISNFRAPSQASTGESTDDDLSDYGLEGLEYDNTEDEILDMADRSSVCSFRKGSMDRIMKATPTKRRGSEIVSNMDISTTTGMTSSVLSQPVFRWNSPSKRGKVLESTETNGTFTAFPAIVIQDSRMSSQPVVKNGNKSNYGREEEKDSWSSGHSSPELVNQGSSNKIATTGNHMRPWTTVSNQSPINRSTPDSAAEVPFESLLDKLSRLSTISERSEHSSKIDEGVETGTGSPDTEGRRSRTSTNGSRSSRRSPMTFIIGDDDIEYLGSEQIDDDSKRKRRSFESARDLISRMLKVK